MSASVDFLLTCKGAQTPAYTVACTGRCRLMTWSWEIINRFRYGQRRPFETSFLYMLLSFP